MQMRRAANVSVALNEKAKRQVGTMTNTDSRPTSDGVHFVGASEDANLVRGDQVNAVQFCGDIHRLAKHRWSPRQSSCVVIASKALHRFHAPHRLNRADQNRAADAFVFCDDIHAVLRVNRINVKRSANGKHRLAPTRLTRSRVTRGIIATKVRFGFHNHAAHPLAVYLAGDSMANQLSRNDFRRTQKKDSIQSLKSLDHGWDAHFRLVEER
jgi:hypothetical protein